MMRGSFTVNCHKDFKLNEPLLSMQLNTTLQVKIRTKKTGI